MGFWPLKYFAAVVVVTVFQLDLFSDLRVFGVMPELLLGLTVAAGWQGGSDRGAVMGFIAGLLYDLYLPTPFALNALTYALVGYGVGVVAEVLAESTERLVRRLLGMASVCLGLVVFMILGELLGEQNLYNDQFPRILVVATLYTGLFLPLLHLLIGWVVRDDDATNVGSIGLVK